MEVRQEATRRQARRGQSQTNVEETLHQNRISYRTPAQYLGEMSAASTHTHINKHKHIFTCTWVHSVPAFSQEGTKEGRCVLSLCLLCSSTWRDFWLGVFNLHRAENPHEGYSVAFPGGRHSSYFMSAEIFSSRRAVNQMKHCLMVKPRSEKSAGWTPPGIKGTDLFFLLEVIHLRELEIILGHRKSTV